jgi:hypothetical protein
MDGKTIDDPAKKAKYIKSFALYPAQSESMFAAKRWSALGNLENARDDGQSTRRVSHQRLWDFKKPNGVSHWIFQQITVRCGSTSS